MFSTFPNRQEWLTMLTLFSTTVVYAEHLLSFQESGILVQAGQRMSCERQAHSIFSIASQMIFLVDITSHVLSQLVAEGIKMTLCDSIGRGLFKSLYFIFSILCTLCFSLRQFFFLIFHTFLLINNSHEKDIVESHDSFQPINHQTWDGPGHSEYNYCISPAANLELCTQLKTDFFFFCYMFLKYMAHTYV